MLCISINLLFCECGLFLLVGNIALYKHAYQELTSGGHTADRAVDGGTNPSLDAGSCAYAYVSQGQLTYWRLDFGFLHVIINLTIINRDDSQR